MDDNGESWIESGLDYIEDSNCPFCGQSLAGNNLVEAYRAYFDAAYQSLKNEIDQFSQRIHQLLSENAILDLQREVASNDELTEFWKDQVEAQYPGIKFETTIQRPWQDLRRNLAGILAQKAATPLEQLEPDESLRTATEVYNSRAEAAVADYNQTLDEANELIESKKKETKEGNLTQAREELESLKNRQVRHKPGVDKLCQEYEKLRKEKRALETAKEQAKVDLDQYADEIIEAYGPSLNEHLAKCGAGFRIIELGKNYMGGKPRADYCLQVDGRCVDLGGADTPACEPSFKNTLSSGDRSALAFAFFITKLKRDPDLEKKIVVVDDPASSLDAQRRSYTCHQIAWLGNHCKQVIVLTHSAQLARQVWDSAKRISPPKTLWIRREGDYSVIDNDDIVERTQGEYFKNYFDICKYLEEGPEDDRHSRSIALCIRPVLEGYLRHRFPQEFGAGEWLGDFVGKLAEAGTGDALYSLKPQLEELSAWAKRTLAFIS
jgi:wobble nucleotide-excising tRNase